MFGQIEFPETIPTNLLKTVILVIHLGFCVSCYAREDRATAEPTSGRFNS
jgi:hypothetical protein